MVAGGVVGYLAGTQPVGQPNEASFLADNALAAHVIYAAEKRHTVEVGADEKDHLVAWLSKRVGLSLVAPNLEVFGFSLVGGRLLPSRDRAAAQFMYENSAGERISLYVTTVEGKSETGFQLVEEPRRAGILLARSRVRVCRDRKSSRKRFAEDFTRCLPPVGQQRRLVICRVRRRQIPPL